MKVGEKYYIVSDGVKKDTVYEVVKIFEKFITVRSEEHLVDWVLEDCKDDQLLTEIELLLYS